MAPLPDAPAPFRIQFDNARDPRTARNALGILEAAAPIDAQYITAAADPTLTNERLLTDTATVTWDFSTAGQAKANAASSFTSVIVQIFIASGTYTPTVNMKYCIVECVGGGGAGGGSVGTAGNYFAGGGGGAGGYSRARLTAAQIGASKAVTIGAGGTGVSAADGNAGGDTSLGSLCVAKGGLGGRLSVGTGASIGRGEAGGSITGAVGDVIASGDPGGNGLWGVAPGGSGEGGSSFFGGGGAPIYSASASIQGNNGSNYGAGGSGGNAANTATSSSGGNGSSGAVIITEFI